MAQSGVSTVQPHLGLPALLSITQSPPRACYTTPSALLPCERLPALGIGPRHHHPGCHSRSHPGPVPPLSIRKTPLIFQDLPSTSPPSPLCSPALCATASVGAPAALSCRSRRDFCHICSPRETRTPSGKDEIGSAFICAPESGT